MILLQMRTPLIDDGGGGFGDVPRHNTILVPWLSSLASCSAMTTIYI